MLTVDRFEEDKAVIFDDDRQMIIDRDKLSPFVKEGDVIIISDSGIYVPDKAKTAVNTAAANLILFIFIVCVLLVFKLCLIFFGQFKFARCVGFE